MPVRKKAGGFRCPECKQLRRKGVPQPGPRSSMPKKQCPQNWIFQAVDRRGRQWRRCRKCKGWVLVMHDQSQAKKQASETHAVPSENRGIWRALPERVRCHLCGQQVQRERINQHYDNEHDGWRLGQAIKIKKTKVDVYAARKVVSGGAWGMGKKR